MSIALMQMAIERDLPAKIGQMILFNPVTDTQMKLKSYEAFEDGPFLSAASMDWMIDAFLPNANDRKTALASPLSFASDEILSKFPRRLFLLGMSTRSWTRAKRSDVVCRNWESTLLSSKATGRCMRSWRWWLSDSRRLRVRWWSLPV